MVSLIKFNSWLPTLSTKEKDSPLPSPSVRQTCCSLLFSHFRNTDYFKRRQHQAGHMTTLLRDLSPGVSFKPVSLLLGLYALSTAWPTILQHGDDSLIKLQ